MYKNIICLTMFIIVFGLFDEDGSPKGCLKKIRSRI